MRLNHGLHLAYCTNIHRGEDWPQTLESLKTDVMAVRRRVCPDKPYAIGLRLSDQASRELLAPGELDRFKAWLDEKNCYVFTINGFPYGRFHNTRVKEQVYAPDWRAQERLDYTNRLFDILAELVPEGVEGSVSTLPGSFKEFIKDESELEPIYGNLWKCAEHIDALSQRTGRRLHLGLEPEPLGLFENSEECVRFFAAANQARPNDDRFNRFIGINYDTCHLAVEYEAAREAIGALRAANIFISKLHLSSALKVRPTPETLAALKAFGDDVYLHQVIARKADGSLLRAKDLDIALAEGSAFRAPGIEEWRIHFHIPLHSPATELFDNTSDHLIEVMDLLKDHPALCSHLEMETYTWEVMPGDMKKRSVVDQLVGEYEWTLDQLRQRGLD